MRTHAYFITLPLALTLLAATGCKHKDEPTETPSATVAYDPSGGAGAGADATPARVELRDDRIVIHEKIQFDLNKATIRPASDSLLREIATVIKANPQLLVIRVEGHTDGDGDELSNLRLSQGRARSVMNYLIKAGVSSSRLTSVGFGEGSPIADNDTEEGKSNNRRVEFIIVKMAPPE